MPDARYLAYLRSSAWRRQRRAALERAGGRCQHPGCFRSSLGGPLHVHHVSYSRLGSERPEDLIVLCREHHEMADEQRAERVQRDRQAWLRRVDAWARKVAGSNWRWFFDEERVE